MIVIGVVATSMHISIPFLNRNSERGYYTFFFGILLAKLFDIVDVQVKWIQAVSVAFAITFIALINMYAKLPLEHWITVFILLPVMIIIAKSKLLKSIYPQEFLKKCDESFFDLYIWHVIILHIICIINKIRPIHILRSHIGLVLTTMLLVLVGIVSHEFLSKPIDKFIAKKRANN
jgi:hypothetical protein